MTISARTTLLPLPLLAAPSPQDPRPLVLYHGRCADGFAAALAAWRWRGRLTRAPKRWSLVLLVLLAAFAVLFVDATLQRARTVRLPEATVAKALADDPRFLLWQHTFERIAQRPWTGYGYGKSILREELQGEMGDRISRNLRRAIRQEVTAAIESGLKIA